MGFRELTVGLIAGPQIYMTNKFLDARLRKILSDCKLQWLEDCRELQAQLGVKGQFGGSSHAGLGQD